VTYLTTSGIQFIVLLQSADWLTAPARLFTFLGTANFFIAVLPAIYWCIDAGLGIRVGFILLFGSAFNELAKLALCGPRPYWVSMQVKALAAEPSFGAPSGHAQIAAGVWGTIAARLHRTWAWIAAGFLVLLIGMSRLVLGVHFPLDVVLGWLLGAATLWAFIAYWDRIAARIKERTFAEQVRLALALCAFLIIIALLMAFALRSYVLPAGWMANAARAGQPLPDPTSLDGVLTATGTLLGFTLGLAWIGQRGGFSPSGPLWKRALCFVIGLIGVLMLYVSLSLALRADGVWAGSSLRVLRYALVGLWISAGAPWVFMRARLVPAHPGQTSPG
jgi:membrane-associated phospholipid phosphatase